MTRISKILPTTPPAVVQEAGAGTQLQIIFDEVALKKAKLREQKLILREELEKDEDYVKAKEKFVAAREKLKSAKAAASRGSADLIEQIDRIGEQVRSAEENASALALKELQEGRSVEITTRGGQKVAAQLRVRFVREKDAGEEE